MIRFKQLFDKKEPHIILPPGEYEGTLTIEHSCTFDGGGSTLWSKKWPALSIIAPNVTVKNLRIELTGGTPDDAVIIVKGKNTKFDNVEVYGSIKGLKDETGLWKLPRVVNLGKFASNKQNFYSLPITSGKKCHIISDVSGLNVSPQNISSGEVELKFDIEPLRDKTSLYGSILFKTDSGIIRRIYVTGQALNNAPALIQTVKKESIKNPSSKKKIHKGKTISENHINSTHNNTMQVSPSRSEKYNDNTVCKGQRVIVPEVKKIEVVFNADTVPRGIEIDACAFCLNSNKQVSGDTDFVYFGNPQHESRAVSLIPKDNNIGIALYPNDVPQEITTIAVCFSIYDEGNRDTNNFKSITSPQTLVFAGDQLLFNFPMQLNTEKIVTALEFYRYKNQWKINFIGSGYMAGLRKLCESYGLDVI